MCNNQICSLDNRIYFVRPIDLCKIVSIIDIEMCVLHGA